MKTYILRPIRPINFTKNSSLSGQIVSAIDVNTARRMAVKAARDTDKDPNQWAMANVVECRVLDPGEHLRICDFGIEDVE